MSEAKDLAKKIVDFLAGEGWTVWQNNSGWVLIGKRRIFLGPPDYADVIGHTDNGRFVNIEIKIGDDKLTPGQIDVLYKIAKSKYGIAACVTSWDHFRKWYSDMERYGFGAQVTALKEIK